MFSASVGVISVEVILVNNNLQSFPKIIIFKVYLTLNHEANMKLTGLTARRVLLVTQFLSAISTY